MISLEFIKTSYNKASFYIKEMTLNMAMIMKQFWIFDLWVGYLTEILCYLLTIKSVGYLCFIFPALLAKLIEVAHCDEDISY